MGVGACEINSFASFDAARVCQGFFISLPPQSAARLLSSAARLRDAAKRLTDRELKPPALVLGGRSGSFGLAGSGLL